MNYELRTVGDDRQVRTLRLQAGSLQQARQAAENRGLAVLAVRPAGLRRARRPVFALATFCQELQTLLEAGLGVVESIEALAEKEAARDARAVLQDLAGALHEGLALSDAAARRGDVFPPLLVGLLRASEHTGDLPAALGRYAEHALRLHALRARLVGAAIYPAVLLAAGAAVSAFLLLAVVPSFAGVYSDSGREMPALSRWLMQWGGFAAAHPGALGTALLLAALAAVAASLHLSRTGGWARLLQRLPVLGPRARLLQLARLYTTLGVLLEGGLPVLGALDLAASSGSGPLHAPLQQVRRRVLDGEPLSQALDGAALGTPVALRMLRAGERSGRLGAMLLRSAALHDADNARWIERCSRIVEPALMLVIGLGVGGIVVLLYLPIFDLAGAVQ